MHTDYAENMVRQVVRDLARSPHRIFHEVPVEFGGSVALLSAETNAHLITVTLTDFPIPSYADFLNFLNSVFERLHGYRVSIKFVGKSELRDFANDHLAEVYAHWQCRFDVQQDGNFSLEVFRIRYKKKS